MGQLCSSGNYVWAKIRKQQRSSTVLSTVGSTFSNATQQKSSTSVTFPLNTQCSFPTSIEIIRGSIRMIYRLSNVIRFSKRNI